MPSGAKKRKAGKRKNQKTAVDIPGDNQQQGLPPSPNPSSDFLSPMVKSRGNGHERRRSAIDDEFEETFETPRFQSETPRFPPETPYYSTENLNLRNSRSEVNVLPGESSKSLDMEIPLKEEESFEMKEEECDVIAENSDDSHEEIPSEEGEEGQKDDEGLKETKLDEKEEESPVKEDDVMWENLETEDVWSINESVPVDEERTPTEDVRLIEKSVPVDEETTLTENVRLIEKSLPVDEERTPTEDVRSVEKSVPVDEERILTENVRWIEKSVSVDEERTLTEDVRLIEKSVPFDEERIPNVSIGKVDVSSSNEKEVKVVLWPDLEIPAGNGVVNVDVEVICSEKEGDGDGDGNRNLERELNLGDENKQLVTLDENSKDVVESVQEMLPQIDVELTNNKFDLSVEKISVSAENSALITEEAGHGSKTPPVNSESLVGVCDASPHGRMKTSAEPSSDAEKTGIEQRNKVACGPGRHAKVWNCCGLLDVFTSSDR